MAGETHEAPVGLDGEAVAGITGEAGDEAAEDVRGNRTVAKGGEAFLCEIRSFLQVKTPGRQSDREIYCPILVATGRALMGCLFHSGHLPTLPFTLN